MTNVSYNLYANLRSRYPGLYMLNVRKVYGIRFWRDILLRKPDIIHYFPGPTLRGLLLVKFLQLLTGSKTVISATKPDLGIYFRKVSPIVKPNIVLVQSTRSEKLFKSVNYRTEFIPNGVDTNRFRPADHEKKKALRNKYGFGEKDFIALHVGPVTNGRNQESMLHLTGVKILLVVSVTNLSKESAYKGLTHSTKDATIWREYFPNIEEIYAIADVYVFPVIQDLNSIDIPLSVLEAMSCNLPVVTTRFGALDRMFQNIEGLFFVDRLEDVQEIVDGIKKGSYKIDTRKHVLSLSWQNVVKKISKVYESVHLS